MNFNPMEMLILSMIQGNPQLAQYADMARQMTAGKSSQQVQQIAQNLAKQNGINIPQIQQMIQQMMGGMKF